MNWISPGMSELLMPNTPDRIWCVLCRDDFNMTGLHGTRKISSFTLPGRSYAEFRSLFPGKGINNVVRTGYMSISRSIRLASQEHTWTCRPTSTVPGTLGPSLFSVPNQTQLRHHPPARQKRYFQIVMFYCSRAMSVTERPPVMCTILALLGQERSASKPLYRAFIERLNRFRWNGTAK